MFGTFRIVRGELTKIFTKPAIFVMTAFFVLAMVFSALVFNPTPRQDNRIKMDAQSVNEVYDAFYSTTDNYRFKSTYDLSLESTQNYLDFYLNSSSTSYIKKQTLETNVNNLMTEYQEFCKLANADETHRQKVLSQVDILNQNLQNINKSYPTLILTKDTYNDLISNVAYVKQALSTTIDEHNPQSYQTIIDNLQENQYVYKIESLVKENVKDVIISQNILDNLSEITTQKAPLKQTAILNEIDDFHENINSKGDGAITNTNNIQEILNIASKYKLLVEEVQNIVYSKIMIEISNEISGATSSYYGDRFASYNEYQYKETYAQNLALFNNNVYEFEYANVFQAGFASNYETDAFDYMYYAMELLSILIVLFCVIFGADMIAGEQSNGTLKMLAIRPYKRSKILKGKFLATIIFGVIFAIIGIIASFIIGAFIYGVNLTPVFVTFNASLCFSISPITLMLIYLLALIIRITFYSLIALCLSTIFKSNIASIAVSFIIYLLVALFSATLKNSFIYRFIPFNNADLFKYFGGEFLNNGSDATIFGLDFTPPISAGMSFGFSILNILIFSVVIYIITLIVFKKRDIS